MVSRTSRGALFAIVTERFATSLDCAASAETRSIEFAIS